jgi:hypothetical protein
MKSDIKIRDDGKFWGLHIWTNSDKAEQFTKDYFKGLSKKQFYIPYLHKDFFLSEVQRHGLSIENV